MEYPTVYGENGTEAFTATQRDCQKRLRSLAIWLNEHGFTDWDMVQMNGMVEVLVRLRC